MTYSLRDLRYSAKLQAGPSDNKTKPWLLCQQVLEAVCILLGVKADWNTAKVLMADPTLIQKVQGALIDHIYRKESGPIPINKFIVKCFSMLELVNHSS